MTSHPLTNLSALDGRYRSKLEAMAELTSELALMRYRVRVECAWFEHLAGCARIAELPALDAEAGAALHAIADDFGLTDGQRIKEFEATTNHDVKAVEYFVKERLSAIAGLAEHGEFVHFACTSEDINNLSYGLMIKDSRELILDLMDDVIGDIEQQADQSVNTPMLSRTHGQAASPTTLGKELRNFAARLQRQRDQLKQVTLLGKMNGAVGNFNAHTVAYPDVDWPQESAMFVASLGLTCNTMTTQIEPHDYMAEVFHALIRFNQVLLDFARDVWSYIAIDYFSQRKVEGETGSSTMPHKVNPIDFENSEGNLGIANALLEHMASKLQVSRWQRDLSDSTVLRNIGSALGHCALAYQAANRGMQRLEINDQVMARDLDQSWEVLAEAVQTVMRKHGMTEPYERLKAATHGRQLDAVLFSEILQELQLPDAAVTALQHLRPAEYTGLAALLAKSKP